MPLKQPRTVYKLKPGYQLPQKLDEAHIQRVGARLAELGRGDYRQASAGAIVDDATRPMSPLHSLFDWDDAAVARKHRLGEAVRIRDGIYVLEGGGERIVNASPRQSVSMPLERAARTAYVASNLTPRSHQVREYATEELTAWLDRYAREPALRQATRLVERAVEALKRGQA